MCLPRPLQPEMGQNLLLSTRAVSNKTCPLAVLKPFHTKQGFSSELFAWKFIKNWVLYLCTPMLNIGALSFCHHIDTFHQRNPFFQLMLGSKWEKTLSDWPHNLQYHMANTTTTISATKSWTIYGLR